MSKKVLKTCTTKEDLAKAVERSLMYYCWGKYEWEGVISQLSSHPDRAEIKVDTYNQIKNNWDIFIDYIWSYKNARKAKQTE